MDENHYYCGWTADNDKFPQAPWIADIEEICVSNVSGFIPGAVARIPENAIVSSIFDDNRLISEPSLILILDSDESIETIRQILGNKVYILKYYKKYKFLLVEVPWNNIQETVSLDCVLKAHPCNAVYASLNSSTSMTNTKNVWFQIKRRQVGFGIRIPYLKTNLGSGVDIAVIDSGIDSLHRDFKGRIVNWKNMREDRFPLDGHGHGTHCSSIALGSGVSSSDFRFAGNARNAGLMPIGVLDEGGGGIISDIIDGIVCATDTNGDGDTGDHVDVISMSLGIYIGSDGTTPESIAAREAVNSGCVFVKSAGNQGLYGYNTITSPGDVGEVISVGAID
ncbi:S8 family serine peptidase, partial [bacterium]|nr:S8 family serine peptidase [bacterium]